MATPHDLAALMKNINNGTLDELNDQQIFILKQFGARVRDIVNPTDDEYLLRWLVARKFDIKKAEDMLRAHTKLFKDLDIDGIAESFTKTKVLEDVGYGYLGFDKDGNGTFIFMMEFLDLKGVANSATVYDQIVTAIYEIERALNSMKNRKDKKTMMKLNLIVDLSGAKLPRSWFVIQQELRLLQTFEANYPEIANKIIIINIPAIFYPWFNCLKFALEGRTLNKISYHTRGGGKEAILDLIDADLVPTFMGGKRKDFDGDPSCRALFPKVRKISKSYYYKYQCFSDRILLDPKAVETEIDSRSYMNIVVDVPENGSWIHWLIRTRGYNLGFGIYYCDLYKPHDWEEHCKDIKNDHVNWIQPLVTWDTHPTPMEWKAYCKRSGKYICHFDNTYSWLTAKQFAFVIAIVFPDKTRKYISDF